MSLFSMFPVLVMLLGVLIARALTTPALETLVIAGFVIVGTLLLIIIVNTCKEEFARRKKEKEETRQ